MAGPGLPSWPRAPSPNGIGLARAAGDNADVLLLPIGVPARYTDLITPPAGWNWFENGRVLAILGGLLSIDAVADTIPFPD